MVKNHLSRIKDEIEDVPVTYIDENGNPIDYIGTFEIEDTGGDERIKNGNCIDIYIPSYQEAINFGRKQVIVYLIEAKG